MLKDQQIVKGVISYIDDDGNGVMKMKGDTIFVRNVMAKEEVSVQIKRRIRSGYTAELKQILKADATRCEAPCNIYGRCGSCHLMHMKIEAQAAWKKKQIMDLCRKEKVNLRVRDVMTMKDPHHYRNKMIIGFEKDKRHQIHAGFYEEFSHRIIPYKKCLLHPEICDEIVGTITELLQKFRVEIYDEDRRRGLLRHVVLRYGEVSGQIMVVLVINSNVFPARKNFVQALVQKHPEITTIVQNVNTRKTSVVLGNEERVLYGPGYIEDTLCGCVFRISAKSFYQINHAQTEVLYETAISLLKLKGTEKVLDAYCGIGTIGMYASHKAKEVIGVEINKDAVQDALCNASLNHIKNIRFLCDDAGRYMQKLAARKEKLDVVIMDPPRSGSSEEFIRSVVKLRVEKVLYISCNPKTQLRDIKMFEKMGYKVDSDMYLVDLFPFTNHVESVVKLIAVK